MRRPAVFRGHFDFGWSRGRSHGINLRSVLLFRAEQRQGDLCADAWQVGVVSADAPG